MSPCFSILTVCIYTISKCLPGTLFLWGVKRAKVSSWDPFFYGMACVDCMDCITYTARIYCVDYATHGACSASNDLLSFPHINNSRPRYGESSKGPKTPPTLPTTIQAGPDATHYGPAYHLPILRMYALLISTELRFMRHPTISRHHPSMLVLTSCQNSHPGRPYLAVLGIALGLITRHRAGLYCAI